MDTLKALLDKKVITRKETLKKRNLLWEEADAYAKYVGVTTPFVLKLYRVYGRKNVLGIKSWLKDAPRDPKRFYGLVVWKLKNGNT
jgi:hypothetical protein